MRRLRTPLAFGLGAWVGLVTAAAFVKRAFPSRGDEESDSVALVAVMGGVDLKNRSRAFTGGTLTSWFGGIALDLREAELAPGAQLTAHALFGGIAVLVPPTWRVESDVSAFAGGVDTRTPARDDPDAPTLTVDGTTLFGGVAVAAGPADEA